MFLNKKREGILKQETRFPLSLGFYLKKWTIQINTPIPQPQSFREVIKIVSDIKLT